MWVSELKKDEEVQNKKSEWDEKGIHIHNEMALRWETGYICGNQGLDSLKMFTPVYSEISTYKATKEIRDQFNDMNAIYKQGKGLKNNGTFIQ